MPFSDVCPLCNRWREMTRDHVLPRSRAKRGDLKRFNAIGIENIRYVCKSCNELRGQTYHCPMLASLVVRVADEIAVSPNTLWNAWLGGRSKTKQRARRAYQERMHRQPAVT